MAKNAVRGRRRRASKDHQRGTMGGTQIPLEDRLIYALDGMNLEQAIEDVRELQEIVRIFKVGLPLVLEEGLKGVKRVAEAGEGVRIFLDLKVGDIPETVINAITELAKASDDAVVFATVYHPSKEVLDFIKERDAQGFTFKVVAVTLLTSVGQDEMEMYMAGMGQDAFVLKQAERAKDLGCDGVVCSGQEARMIKDRLGDDFLVITPGIRPNWGEILGDDQKRIVTPSEAIRAGADHIVVGRPIYRAPNKREAIMKIRHEIEDALSGPGGTPATPQGAGESLGHST